MAIFLIFISPDFKLMTTRTALHLHILRTRLLFAHHGINRQLAELQFCMETKQLLTAFDERSVQRERDVCRLKKLQNIIFLSLILQLQLVLEIEGGIGVVVDIETYQVTNLGIEVDL